MDKRLKSELLGRVYHKPVRLKPVYYDRMRCCWIYRRRKPEPVWLIEARELRKIRLHWMKLIWVIQGRGGIRSILKLSKAPRRKSRRS